jgi:hypothetical protein
LRDKILPIQLPDLDTRNYDDILGEMIASIPKYTDTWTNHNPSDPGITILELLCWITETTLYRMNHVPHESYVNFLRLVAGASGVDEVNRLLNDPSLYWSHRKILEFLKEIENGNTKNVEEIKATALNFLKSRYRAVTEDDFCALAIEATDSDMFHAGDFKDPAGLSAKLQDASDPLSRYFIEQFSPGSRQLLKEHDTSAPSSKELQWVLVNELNRLILGPCLYDKQRFADVVLRDETQRLIEQKPTFEAGIRLNRLLLEQVYPNEIEETTRHAKVKKAIVRKLPDEEKVEIIIISDRRDKYDELIEWVKNYLRPRKLIGTIIEVKKPVYTDVTIDIKVKCQLPARAHNVENNVRSRILHYLDPFEGGPGKKGLPYGRPLTLYEMAQIIEETNGVKQIISLIFDKNETLKIKEIDGLIDSSVEVEGVE